MKSVTFVSFERHYYDRHQFYCLAAYLKSKDCRVSYISGERFDKVLDRLKRESPDLVGYSTFSSNGPTYIEFDKLQKHKLGIKSIIGGPGPAFDPESFSNTTIDAICIGEGEEAIVQYLESGKKSANNTIIGGDSTSVSFNRLLDLERLPFPDREIVYAEEPYLRNMKYRFFLSGRGCPFHCTYCHNHIMSERFKNHGKVVRKKPVDYFIEEIKEVSARYNPRLIVMQDDTFVIDKNWLADFRDKYRRFINIPFTCNIRANLVDERVVEMLKEAGCIGCNWSIESGNDEIRNTVLKRNMTKDQIINTARLLKKYGIRHRVANIIGIPGETFGNIEETIELNIRCAPHLASGHTLVPYPNLEITNYAIEKGYLDPARLKDLPNVFWALSVLNFPRSYKIKLLKTTYLFPLFVDMPVLYRNRFIKGLLYCLPVVILKYINALVDMYKMGTLYSFKPGLSDIVNIAARYFKYSMVKYKSVKTRTEPDGGKRW